MREASGTSGGDKKCTEFRWGNPKERDYLEDLYVNEKILLKLTLKKLDGMAWTGFIWFSIRTNGGLP